MKKLLIIYAIFIYFVSSINCSERSGFSIINNDKKNILLTFAGWSVKLEWAENWSKCISSAMNLSNYQIISVKGPDDVFYKNKDNINVDSLATYFIVRDYDTVIVIAHSSGSYVAQNFFHVLYQKDKVKKNKNKFFYFNLDGGVGDNDNQTLLTSEIANYLNKIHTVYVYDELSDTYSPNFQEMIEIGKNYINAETIKLIPKEQICNAKAKWCLHDYLINLYPFNKDKFDLEKDYNYIKQETVNVEYLRYFKW